MSTVSQDFYSILTTTMRHLYKSTTGLWSYIARDHYGGKVMLFKSNGLIQTTTQDCKICQNQHQFFHLCHYFPSRLGTTDCPTRTGSAWKMVMMY